MIPVSRDPVDQPRTAQQRKNTGKEPVKGNKRFPIPMIAVHPKRRKKWYSGNFSNSNPAKMRYSNSW